MSEQYQNSPRRRFWPLLAVGVPWVLGVGLVVAAQHVQSGNWLVQSLLALTSSSGESESRAAERAWEQDAFAHSFRFETGSHVATLDAVAPTAAHAWVEAPVAPLPELWRADEEAAVLVEGTLVREALARVESERARVAIEQALNQSGAAALRAAEEGHRAAMVELQQLERLKTEFHISTRQAPTATKCDKPTRVVTVDG
jgi:hypothetical protein